jgi:hypothetical protein
MELPKEGFPWLKRRRVRGGQMSILKGIKNIISMLLFIPVAFFLPIMLVYTWVTGGTPLSPELLSWYFLLVGVVVLVSFLGWIAQLVYLWWTDGF